MHLLAGPSASAVLPVLAPAALLAPVQGWLQLMLLQHPHAAPAVAVVRQVGLHNLCTSECKEHCCMSCVTSKLLKVCV